AWKARSLTLKKTAARPAWRSSWSEPQGQYPGGPSAAEYVALAAGVAGAAVCAGGRAGGARDTGAGAGMDRLGERGAGRAALGAGRARKPAGGWPRPARDRHPLPA